MTILATSSGRGDEWMPGMGDVLVIGASDHVAAATIGSRLAARGGNAVTGCEMPVEFLRGRQWGGEPPVLSLMTNSPEGQRVEDLREGHPGHEFCATALRMGVKDANWAVLDGDHLKEFKQLCSWHDLVVVQRPEDPASNPLAAFEALLRHGRLPVLLLPSNSASSGTYDRVALAWDGSNPAARALRASLPLCLAAREVLLLDGSPARGSEPRFDPEAFLSRYGIRVTRDRVRQHQPSADDLMDNAHRHGADVMAMGAYGHTPLAERLLGGVTREVLLSSNIAVLLHH